MTKSSRPGAWPANGWPVSARRGSAMPVRNRPRTSRRGQVEHHLLLCLRHQPDLLDQHTHHVRPRVATLTTCDLVSQWMPRPPPLSPVDLWSDLPRMRRPHPCCPPNAATNTGTARYITLCRKCPLTDSVRNSG